MQPITEHPEYIKWQEFTDPKYLHESEEKEQWRRMEYQDEGARVSQSIIQPEIDKMREDIVKLRAVLKELYELREKAINTADLYPILQKIQGTETLLTQTEYYEAI